MKKESKIISSLFFFLLSIVVILTTVDFFCFQRSFYEKEYQESGTAESIGMSDEGLMDATNTLLDYLKDYRDDIVVEVEVNGDVREVFNERETLHMVDVKELYLNVVKLRNAMVVACIALLIYLWKTTGDTLRDILKIGYGYGIGLVFLFVVFLGIWAIADFNAFWTRFHLIFFDNDLWLLDPNTSIMINMFPSNFFQDLVVRIIITVVGILAAIRILLNVGRKKQDDTYRTI